MGYLKSVRSPLRRATTAAGAELRVATLVDRHDQYVRDTRSSRVSPHFVTVMILGELCNFAGASSNLQPSPLDGSLISL